MATLYGKGRGKARSHAPKPEKPQWLKLEAKDVEKIVVDLAKKDIGVAKIGLILRDSFGVPNVRLITGKKINKILEEHGLAKKEPVDLAALEKRTKALKRHIEKNKKDTRAKRGLQLTEAKVRRLKKYYKRKKKAKK